MTVEKLGAGRLALVLERSELETDGNGGIDMEKAQELARQAFIRCGLDAIGAEHLELEAFSGGGEVLIFACLTCAGPYACSFGSFDEVLRAAGALDMWDIESVGLYYLNGYILLNPRPFPAGCAEYGDLTELKRDEEAFIKEHGKCLSGDFFAETQHLFRYQ